MTSTFKALAFLTFLFTSTNSVAATRSVNSILNDANTIGTLPYWLLNANDGDVLDCSLLTGLTITLSTSLPAITKSYTINGSGITIDGAGSYQAFQVASGTTVIKNVTIQNTLSKGGNGGSGYSGGGGAVGGGGALYIHGGGTVTLEAASLSNNVAKGGDGGSADNNGNGGAGGGGGFGGGNGGSSLTLVSTGGGGGGHSNGGDGGSQFSINGSNGVYFGGGGGGAGVNIVSPGGVGGNASPMGLFLGGAESSGNGGGGAGDSENGFAATGTGGSGIPGNGGNGIGTDFLFGGGGGGGTASETSFPGATGIGAGGGGGAFNFSGGAGGILGGGGGAGMGGVGGDGGFGAGGGGAVTGGTGGGGFNAGGGNGASDPSSVGGGGGGSGLGGAIFIQSDATLTIVNPQQITNNSAVAGVGGSSTNSSDPGYIPAGDGLALGQDIFMREQGSIIFNISNTLTLTNPIAGDQTNGPATSGGLQKIGNGILNLNGANTYSGLTSINGGTLNLNGSVIGNVTINSGGKLSGNATVGGNLTNSGTVHIDINSGGTSSVAVTGTASLAGTLEVGIASNTLSGKSTVLTSSAITGTFSNVRFTQTTPAQYTASYLPTGAPTRVEFYFVMPDANVTGNGTIAGSSKPISFNMKGSFNSQNQIVATMFYNDPGAQVHFDNPVVTSLNFNGNVVTLAGTANVNNQKTTFSATVTSGNPGSLSVNLGNGYSASGNLTSGGISVQ